MLLVCLFIRCASLRNNASDTTSERTFVQNGAAAINSSPEHLRQMFDRS
jgi:hypothetical protein